LTKLFFQKKVNPTPSDRSRHAKKENAGFQGPFKLDEFRISLTSNLKNIRFKVLDKHLTKNEILSIPILVNYPFQKILFTHKKLA
jgi:hypothetical protein